jgi:hypothetical protein
MTYEDLQKAFANAFPHKVECNTLLRQMVGTYLARAGVRKRDFRRKFRDPVVRTWNDHDEYYFKNASDAVGFRLWIPQDPAIINDLKSKQLINDLKSKQLTRWRNMFANHMAQSIVSSQPITAPNIFIYRSGKSTP